MSIKEKSTFKKHELEYDSPDGDVWNILVVEHGDRKYIQFKKTEDEDFISMDGDMLLDMSDAYRRITQSSDAPVFQGKKSNIEIPSIVDHRAIEQRGADIQHKVEETMKNQDDETAPIQSFSPSVASGDYTSFRTGGITTEAAAQEPDPTPEEWSTKKKEEDLKQWQKDAKDRGKFRPPTKKTGVSGEGFSRVGAKDIMG